MKKTYSIIFINFLLVHVIFTQTLLNEIDLKSHELSGFTQFEDGEILASIYNGYISRKIIGIGADGSIKFENFNETSNN